MQLSRLKHFLLAILLVAASLSSMAQKRDKNLTIQVTAPAGVSLTDAKVTLTQTDYALSYGSITLSTEGKATVKVYAGQHSLSVTKSGFTSTPLSFRVTADTTVTIALSELTQKPFSLTTQVQHDAITGLNDVTLSWNKEAPVFSDDFESYDAFAISFSPWTGIDGDNLAAARLTGTYENRGVLQYAQIINPLKVEPTWWYDYPVLRPRSGQQYVGFVRTESGAANDDWLISPAITPGNLNSLSFWAKAADIFKEKFQVYVTEKIDNPQAADFTMLNGGNYETVDYKRWTKFSYDLSAYAGKQIKFAIRYISSAANGGAFMLMVDDVTVGQDYSATSASAPRKSHRIATQTGAQSKEKSPMNPNESFRVFLNGTQVATTEGYEHTFTGLQAGTYKLGVQAVYSASESEMADTTIVISTDGLVSLTVNVSTNNGQSLDSATVELTDALTAQVQSAIIKGGKAAFPSLPAGHYLLGVNAEHFQVLKQDLTVNRDTVISIVVKEAIITPYNITADVQSVTKNNSTVTLKWNQNLSFSDSFEDYADFMQYRFGGWRSYDLDGHTVYPIGLGSSSNIVTFPGASTTSTPRAIAPIVFNPWATTPPMMPTDQAVAAPTGKKTVVFFSPMQNGANKWLISPEVTVRDNFVCRFTAKAYGQYVESMEVCVFAPDSANPNVNSWEVASTISQVSYGQWMIYETDLSKWVGKQVKIGLHYTTYDGFFTQIDDFYVGNLSDDGSTIDVGGVQSYSVSLDSVPAASVSEPQCVLTAVKDGQHTAGIQAIYKSGASELATYTFTVTSDWAKGDLNHDGLVNVDDVTELVTAILDGNTTNTAYDIDANGSVNVDDVTALVNLILGQ